MRRTRIVKQYVRMNAVTSPAVSTATLSFVFHNVYPAAISCLFQQAFVFFAERSKSFYNKLECLFVRKRKGRPVHYGNGQIVHMKLIVLKCLLSQSNIPMKFVYVFIDSLDKVFVNGNGNVVCEKRFSKQSPYPLAFA